jgi:hypothetical protein
MKNRKASVTGSDVLQEVNPHKQKLNRKITVLHKAFNDQYKRIREKPIMAMRCFRLLKVTISDGLSEAVRGLKRIRRIQF